MNTLPLLSLCASLTVIRAALSSHIAVSNQLKQWHFAAADSCNTQFFHEEVGAVTKEARLAYVAASCFPELSTKSQAAAAIKRGELLLNGAQVEACRAVRAGDIISYTPPSARILDARALDALTRFTLHLLEQGLRTVHEDEDIAVVFKPAGIHTKHATNRKYFALEDALAAILHRCSNAVADALPLPLAMHRLDVRVCGLLLVAKTRTGAVSIARQLADRTVEKTYRALLPQARVLQQPQSGHYLQYFPAKLTLLSAAKIGRLPSDLSRVETAVNGQEAQTSVRVLSHVPHAHWGDVTHVELQPHTGRTHQLRIHMAALGAPIIGDDLYHDSIGREARARLGGDPLPPVAVKRGLFLQSVRVAFRHPKHGEMMELAVDEITKHTSLLDKMKRSAEYRKLE